MAGAYCVGVYCVSFVVRCLLSVESYSVFVVRCVSFVVRCMLVMFVVCCASLCGVCCSFKCWSLFALRWLFVDCSLCVV